MAGANKASMEMVKKIYFWVLVPILIIVAFIVATMAIGDIKKKFEEKKKAVEAEKQALDGISADDKHPNDSTIDLIKKETSVLSKSVFEAWTLMYTDQKLRNRWPRQLSKEFLGLVEKLKFRASIDPTKPYLREDYSFFIGNHLPTLLKEVQRRRVQIHDYKYVKAEKRFFPVYVDTEKNIYYILITEGESDRVKEVQIYDIKRDLLTKVENSGERDAYISKERKPYYREMDPWIVTPKDYMTFGMAMNNTPGMGGEMGGMMGDPSMAGGAPGMSGAPGMGGAPGMDGPGGARGSMGGEGMSISSVNIPGDNTDPALEQLPSSVGNSTGAGTDLGMGVGGVGNDKGISYPGLPPYEERKKIVGNVDWENPEIYALPTWSKGGYPKSIEIWYAQESLWVYEAMIRVIAETNKEAPDNINLAPVKAVEAMLIGQPAGAAWASVKNALGDLTGKTMSADSMLMGSGSEMMSPSSMPDASSASGSEMGNMAASTELTENEILNRILFGRYLDLENKPLDATTAPPFAEFNKMPVCMKLIIDQRRIPDLLVNCANCSMPIDIKHVRICPDNLVPFGNVSGMGGMDAMGGDPSMMGALGGAPGGSGPMGGARGSMGSEGGPGNQSASIEVGRSEISQINGYGNDAIRVEIYGIINIFNEPDLTKLATGNTTEDEKTDSETDSADNTSENKTEDGTGTPAPANPAGTPAPANPAGTPAPANPAGTPIPANPAGTPAPANPAGTPAPANPAGTPAPANPAGTPAPANPAGTPAPANPAGTSAPANPAGTPAPANPAGTSAPANPAGTPAPANPT